MALYAALKAVHLLALMAWMGGMFFAVFCLRPAALAFPPDVRVPLMVSALGRFLTVAGVSALLVLASGFTMVSQAVRATRATGAPFNSPLEWWVMAALGILMVLVYGHVRFALYRRAQRAAGAKDWPAGGQALESIRRWVIVNLALGVMIVAVMGMAQVG